MTSGDPKERPDAESRSDDELSLAENADGGLTPDGERPEDILDKLPSRAQRDFLQMFASMTSTRMSVGNSVMDRLTDEHISEILSIRREETQLEYRDKSHLRMILTGFAVFVVLVAVGFSVFLADREMDALLIDLFTKVIIALGGFGAGWGASRFRR